MSITEGQWLNVLSRFIIWRILRIAALGAFISYSRKMIFSVNTWYSGNLNFVDELFLWPWTSYLIPLHIHFFKWWGKKLIVKHERTNRHNVKISTLLQNQFIPKREKKRVERTKCLRGRIVFWEEHGVETDGKRENAAHPTSHMSGQGYRWRLWIFLSAESLQDWIKQFKVQLLLNGKSSIQWGKVICNMISIP